MKRKRKWIIVGVVVVLIGAGVIVVTNSQRSAAQSAALANVQMGRVTEATLLSTVDSSGSVAPESKVTLSFNTAGTIAKVQAQVGAHVKKGDVLAELDTSSLELQLAQQRQSFLSQQASYSMTIQPDPNAVKSAQIALDNAAAAYKLAQQKYTVTEVNQALTSSCNNLDDAKKTYDDAVNAYNALLADWRATVNGTAQISPQKAQLDRAMAAYDVTLANCNLSKNTANDNSGVQSAAAQLQQAKLNLDNLMTPSELTLATAKAQLDQARLALAQVQQQLDDAKIVAPFDGVITQVNASVGGTSATIVEADDAQLNIGVLVDETEIGQVTVGQQVKVTFDGLPGTTITGTVGRINPAGTVSQGVVNYLVNVDLAPTTSTLRLDMSANVRIILETHANVLAVPGGAIRSDPQGGYYVNVVDTTGDAIRVDVIAGFTDGDLTEVSGDLQPNDRVYISAPPARQQQGGGLNLFGVRLGGG
jgi:HlyD family secretion protein